VPSDMGERPIRAMHGYHPDEKHSFATLLTNQDTVPEQVTAIPDVYQLMVREALIAKARNKAAGRSSGSARSRIDVVEQPEPLSALVTQ